MGSFASPADPNPAVTLAFEIGLYPPHGGRPEQSHSLDRTLRIGADRANHIVCAGAGVAQFHARLIPDPRGPCLALGDTEAAINGHRVTGNVGLMPGDEVCLGDNRLVVSLRGDTPARVDWELLSADGQASLRLLHPVLVGREPHADLRLDEAQVATRHAELVPVQGTLWVRDHSGDGTFVNDAAVNGACQLRHGDVLRFGEGEFKVIARAITSEQPVAEPPRPAPGPPAAARLWREEPAPAPVPENVSRIHGWNFEILPEQLPSGEEPAPPDARASRPLAPMPNPVEPAPVRAHVPYAPPAYAPAAGAPQPPARSIAATTSSSGTMPFPWYSQEVDRRPRRKSRRRWVIGLCAMLAAAAVLLFARSPEPIGAALMQRLEQIRVQVPVDRFLGNTREAAAGALEWLQQFTRERAPETTALPSPDPVPASLPVTPNEPAQASVASVGAETFVQATKDILALQQTADAGDAAAAGKLLELSRLYLQLATSAIERGDLANAQNYVKLASIINVPAGETTTQGVVTPEEITAPPQTPTPAPEPVTSMDRTLAEAQAFEDAGALISPPGQNALGTLLDAQAREPSNELVRSRLNTLMNHVSSLATDMLARHQYGSVSGMLSTLSRAGIPVVTNGLIDQKPSYLDPTPWHALVVASLLVEADALIQQGSIAGEIGETALDRLEEAWSIDPGNPLVEDMQIKSAGVLIAAARKAEQDGRRQEAARLFELAALVRESNSTLMPSGRI